MKVKDKQALVAEFRKAESKAIESAKAEMAAEHGLERNAKFDKAWGIAWGHGHSNGIDEVKLYFGELAELIRP